MSTETQDPCSCLSVIIPVYNEDTTLDGIVRELLELRHLIEVIIVDDCSSDQTATVAQKLAAEHVQVRYIRHGKNAGKTAAVKTGLSSTTGKIVVIQDADWEYHPSEIPGLIQPILEGYADVVYGSRFLVRKATRVLYFYHYLANKVLTFCSNLLTNLNLTDVETGYKAFRGEIIRKMVIDSSGFGFEIEVTAKIAKLGCAIYEVPISYYGRTYAEGKKIGPLDALVAFWLVLRFNLFCTIGASFTEVPKLPIRGQRRPVRIPRQS